MNKVDTYLKILKYHDIKSIGISIAHQLTSGLIEFNIRSVFLRSRVKHLYGPQEIVYAPDELLVISVVRNGELYIKSFMEHYLSMGVKHIVFLDNGSNDRTVEMLCSYDRVTVLQTDAPYQKYENTMKRYLAERFSKNRWNLCVDIDELFDYPDSTSLSLRDFLQYLNENHYTAVIAQMLDMFSNTPLAELESNINDSLREKYPYYDISAIYKTEYLWSKPENDKIKMHWGGIRKTLFGTNNGLTKAALVMMDKKVKTFVGWHHAKNARIADISCVLKHYPFISSFYTKVQDAVRTGRYGMLTTGEYLAYWNGLERNPNLNLKFETAKRLSGIESLIDQEFLAVSDKYREWVNTHTQLLRS
ncbi:MULTISPECIES: glycosyltransferase family 2 protein [Nostoc]|uniref:Glycosyltransferase family 2 protein n=2 Tax=Nostoc TaxID=1177 RepID=A0ABR8I8Y2_9NOSO|nr:MULTISPECIES: glycosyltransferase family 2 protein [Nostoc]MBD2563738.1 glycosyltransferase family 2 protein [Nostoc linckia FACHB-391]MBD2647222.1 glycosyltransferase family 2 protein [Nostoc foliaceum FACHB-393]